MKKFALVIALAIAVFACEYLSPAADVTATANALNVCRNIGRACKADGGTDCFDKYDECVVDAGLR